MKKLFLLLFITNLIWAQKTYTVLDLEFGDPIKNAKILTSTKQELTQTNKNGEFTLNLDTKFLVINAKNYYEKIIDVSKISGDVIYLEFEEKLNDVVAFADYSQSKELIKEVIKKRKLNHPDNLESYQFIAYNKMLVDTNKDSIQTWKPEKDEKLVKEDSFGLNFKKMIDKSTMFLSERVLSVKHSKQFGNKTVVKANKTSGLKEPIYEMLALQPISYYLDKDEFSFFIIKYTNPVSNKGLEDYKFQILDTIQEKNTKIIKVAFGPKYVDKTQKAIYGYVTIDQETKAITSFFAERSKDPYAYVEMIYKKRNGYYFPQKQYFNFELGTAEKRNLTDEQRKDSLTRAQNDQPVWLDYQTHFTEFKIPNQAEKKEFRGYETEISDEILTHSEKIIEKYRPVALNFREANTFATVDSLFQAEGVNKYLKYSHILTRKTLPIGNKLELDLLNILRYNDYEGIRPQISLRTNEKFHTRLGFQGFAAYGFKDKAIKHGLGASYLVNKRQSGNLFAQYSYDVHAMGRYSPQFFYQKPDLYQALNSVYFSDYYTSLRFIAGYEQDVYKNITLSGIVEKASQRVEKLYSYNFDLPYKKYDFTHTHLNILWKPFAKYVKTPYGKVTLEEKPPYFNLHYMKSWKDLGSDFDFETVEFSAEHTMKSIIGKLKLDGRAGYTWGNVPLQYNFEGRGNAKTGDGILNRFSVAGNLGFETLEPGRFYMDKYLSYQITQQFPEFRIFDKKIGTQVLYRGLWGEQLSSRHILVNANAPNLLYQEVGVETFNILNVLGLGAYYRIGEYAENDFDKDFYLKLTVRFPEF